MHWTDEMILAMARGDPHLWSALFLTCKRFCRALHSHSLDWSRTFLDSVSIGPGITGYAFKRGLRHSGQFHREPLLVAGDKIDLPAILTRPTLRGYHLYKKVMRNCEFPGIGVPVIMNGIRYVSTLRMVPNAKIYALYGRVYRISGYKKNNISRDWRYFTHKLIEVFPQTNMSVADYTAWALVYLLIIQSANYAATKKEQYLIRAILLAWILLVSIAARLSTKEDVILEWEANFAALLILITMLVL